MSNINWHHCKQSLLTMASERRSHKFSRVSKALLPELEGVIVRHLEAIVTRQPSKGKTIK